MGRTAYSIIPLSNRAWVKVESITSGDLTKEMEVDIHLSNAGHSTAIGWFLFSHRIQPKKYDLHTFNRGYSESFFDNAKREGGHLLMMRPGFKVQTKITFILTDEQIKDINSGKQVLNILGAIQYSDIVGKQRWTNVNVIYEPIIKKWCQAD